jgi:hypothetical protein
VSVSQAAFRAAILDAALPVPEGLLDSNSEPAGRRFAVYRNNVVVSLTEAAAVAFPLLRKLLGAQNFEKLAAAFVRKHPPQSPLMMHYGIAMPAFIEATEALAHLGYLPDCARLDLAMRRSYHAADAAELDAVVFADPEALPGLRLDLAPATQILKSAWPLYDLWRYNMEPDAPKPRAMAQDVLITRPEFDPAPHLLPEGAADWLSLLAEWHTLAEATERVVTRSPSFDLTQALSLALETQTFTAEKTKEN